MFEAPPLSSHEWPGERARTPTADQKDTQFDMANIKSQIKRNKQNEKAHERNKAVKTALKSAVRKFREAAETGDKETALEAGRLAAKKLDKAVSKGVIHKNQAANRKSAIAKKAASL
ncbi:small subunit ribosomal protein S20 [Nocardioides terrae]|uniref:Small ribosomal subunit protein bS20 n=2 Tax=Nocardioides terrae TaxID=574651 RepID=A0A1I1D966_9ACTN|nr:small subunit ribosomal protein S20 [Nocardioides terrae]